MTEREFIERYTFDASSDLLGEGGFGRVYRAYDNYEHEYVALKMQDVNPQYPELRLRNEYEKVQRFTHPCIARYKACYTLKTFKGETDVAVMKYYEAGSLDKLMAKGGLTFEQRCSMLEHILEGIDFLHNNGIIHRDLKPQNILIVEHDGKYAPLITDFGISKQLDKGQSSAVSNSILGGTRNYASPEQLKESKIKKNTDLWSFGIIAYEMFTGVLPFNCGTFSPTSEEGRSEYLRQVKSGFLPDALNGVPEPWQRLIRACLVVDNEKRVGHVKDCFDIINGDCNGVDDSSDDSGDTLCDDEVVVTSDDTIVSEPEEQPNVVVVEPGSADVKEKGGKKRKSFLPWLVIALVVTIFAFAIPIVKRVIEDKPGVHELIQDGSMTVVEGGDSQLAKVEVVTESEAMKIDAEKNGVEVITNAKKDEYITVDGVTFKMVWVEGGTFEMGSNTGEADERPVHNVTLDGYWIAETEVTQGLWMAVMGKDESWIDTYGKGSNYPAYYVNYSEAVNFCEKLNNVTGHKYNFRLPTEAEWEYAARGGNKSQGYKFSGNDSISSVAWYNGNSNYSTHEVKKKTPNELGLYDMSGNVWEWCSGWYSSSYYSNSPRKNPKGPTGGDFYVLRGGSWNSDGSNCRVANRISSHHPSLSSRGLRVVASMSF